ncbi:uncharacterized protein [Ptychodera flava]|uniref:uncharacterized protein n=1 Tax=Ptychodera flava TaxID=63121 RepID=UPI00396A1808
MSANQCIQTIKNETDSHSSTDGICADSRADSIDFDDNVGEVYKCLKTATERGEGGTQGIHGDKQSEANSVAQDTVIQDQRDENVEMDDSNQELEGNGDHRESDDDETHGQHAFLSDKDDDNSMAKEERTRQHHDAVLPALQFACANIRGNVSAVRQMSSHTASAPDVCENMPCTSKRGSVSTGGHSSAASNPECVGENVHLSTSRQSCGQSFTVTDPEYVGESMTRESSSSITLVRGNPQCEFQMETVLPDDICNLSEHNIPSSDVTSLDDDFNSKMDASVLKIKEKLFVESNPTHDVEFSSDDTTHDPDYIPSSDGACSDEVRQCSFETQITENFQSKMDVNVLKIKEKHFPGSKPTNDVEFSSDDKSHDPDYIPASDEACSDGVKECSFETETTVEQTTKSCHSKPYVVRSSNPPTGKRKWDKYSYCLYCSKKQAKLVRHLRRRHSTERLVAQAMAVPDREKS